MKLSRIKCLIYICRRANANIFELITSWLCDNTTARGHQRGERMIIWNSASIDEVKLGDQVLIMNAPPIASFTPFYSSSPCGKTPPNEKPLSVKDVARIFSTSCSQMSSLCSCCIDSPMRMDRAVVCGR